MLFFIFSIDFLRFVVNPNSNIIVWIIVASPQFGQLRGKAVQCNALSSLHGRGVNCWFARRRRWWSLALKLLTLVYERLFYGGWGYCHSPAKSSLVFTKVSCAWNFQAMPTWFVGRRSHCSVVSKLITLSHSKETERRKFKWANI